MPVSKEIDSKQVIVFTEAMIEAGVMAFYQWVSSESVEGAVSSMPSD